MNELLLFIRLCRFYRVHMVLHDAETSGRICVTDGTWQRLLHSACRVAFFPPGCERTHGTSFRVYKSPRSNVIDPRE